jgi:putative transposase
VTYNPEIHHRRSIRLKGYDYSLAGAYFVTVCSWGKGCIFGEIADGEIHLNEYGEIVMKCWNGIQDHLPHVETDEFIIMPNRVHGIVFMVGARHAVPLQTIGEQFAKPVSGSLPTIIRSFKSAVTRSSNIFRNTPGTPVWQRNYYEHIIRNDKELQTIREYIRYNPLKWDEDEENPERKETRQRNA